MERTLRDCLAPNIESFCIKFPDNDPPLKTGLICLLPKFCGFAGDDPIKHLKEFHMVCSTMKSQGVSEESVKIRAFPFSLSALAKEWLYDLEPNSITCWNQMQKVFLQRFFPAHKAAAIRREISEIEQNQQESLAEYWERFKKLCSSCPHHQFQEHLLILFFYEGLSQRDREWINASSGGSLMEKTPSQARSLIETMVQNFQQYNLGTIPSIEDTIHSISSPQIQQNHQKKIEISHEELMKQLQQLCDSVQLLQNSKQYEADNRVHNSYVQLEQLAARMNQMVEVNAICSRREKEFQEQPSSPNIMKTGSCSLPYYVSDDDYSYYIKETENNFVKDMKIEKGISKNIENDLSELLSSLGMNYEMLDTLHDACTCGVCLTCKKIDSVISPQIATLDAGKSVNSVRMEKPHQSLVIQFSPSKITKTERSQQKNRKRSLSIRRIPCQHVPNIMKRAEALHNGTWQKSLLLNGNQREEDVNKGIFRYLTYHTP